MFSNKVSLSINKLPLVLVEIIETKKKLKKVLNDFNPDIALVHNTWFNASPSVFDILREQNVKTILKLHNFRYYCMQKLFFHNNHIKRNKICSACGQSKSRFRIFNKYFLESYAKSLMVVLYGKRFFNLLQNSNFKIIVLTEFHKKFLSKLNIPSERVFVIPNLLDTEAKHFQRTISEKQYMVYGVMHIRRERGRRINQDFLRCNFKKYLFENYRQRSSSKIFTKRIRRGVYRIR